ncbi:unnamed protein product [Symbiodinium sp. CCMP2456]|nr:unnamed protein product [Symbiodinium sp. CCMP2456]
MLGRLAALGCIAVFAHAAVHVPTREIAAGVQMPIISIGGRRPLQTRVRFVTMRRGIGGLETANASAIELEKAGIDRKDVFITTKIPGCDLATANIEYDLKQLKTDYIDLLLIHYPSGDCAKALG